MKVALAERRNSVSARNSWRGGRAAGAGAWMRGHGVLGGWRRRRRRSVEWLGGWAEVSGGWAGVLGATGVLGGKSRGMG